LRAAQPDLIVEHLGELRQILRQNGFHIMPQAKRSAESHLPVATVGGLIFNDAGEVLMVRTHKWSDLWGIPGGKIKGGEPAVAALRREIKEETNMDVDEVQFVMVQDCIRSKEFYREAHFVLLNYTCRCAGKPRVKLNDEAREFRWVSPRQALAMKLNQPTQTLLKTVMAQGGTPAKPKARNRRQEATARHSRSQRSVDSLVRAEAPMRQQLADEAVRAPEKSSRNA